MFDGNIIKKLRNDKGLNQLELAEILESTQKNISNYENNKARPDFEVLIRMSEFFNVSIDLLLGKTSKDLNSLSENEELIINTFRSLNNNQRLQFLSMVLLLNDIKKPKKGET